MCDAPPQGPEFLQELVVPDFTRRPVTVFVRSVRQWSKFTFVCACRFPSTIYWGDCLYPMYILPPLPQITGHVREE